MALTHLQCKQAVPKEKPYKLGAGGGLHLLVNPSGSKYWRYKYRFGGKEKTLALGVYPETTLAKATAAHQAARDLLAAGTDPMDARKEQSQDNALTFEAVAEKWHEHWKTGKTKKHVDEVWHRLELDIFPAIGSRPISELTTTMVRKAVKVIEARGAVDMAKRQLQKCNQIMRYAVAHDLAERNPVADIRPGDILQPRKKRNYSRVEAKDLPQLLRDINGYVGGEHTRLAMQLMALTFVRTAELIEATWAEFDLPGRRWNIPSERMKMATPHIVPLSKQAVQVLERLQVISFDADYVFPGDVYKKRHMSNNTILYALYRMGYKSRMTGHGFRGVASTILHEQGWPHEHIELQLAHQERDETSAAYNHALYLPQRAKMMQAWADHLDAIQVDNVVSLGVAKAS
ncbi:DUF4102 domain-containing protein [Allopusillimonas ginsengisoli]|nr:DUF4102 domain-containing protein [Allopusillimonas ginsengisoli]